MIRGHGGDDDPYFPDVGCHVWHACLSCPLPECVYGNVAALRAEEMERRDEAIYRRWLVQEPKDVNALAGAFGVSRRTAYRAVARGRTRDR